MYLRLCKVCERGNWQRLQQRLGLLLNGRSPCDSSGIVTPTAVVEANRTNSLRWMRCIYRNDVVVPRVSRTDNLRRRLGSRRCGDRGDGRSKVDGATEKRSTHLLSVQLQRQRPPPRAASGYGRRHFRRGDLTVNCCSVCGHGQLAVLRPSHARQIELQWRSLAPRDPRRGPSAHLARTEGLPDRWPRHWLHRRQHLNCDCDNKRFVHCRLRRAEYSQSDQTRSRHAAIYVLLFHKLTEQWRRLGLHYKLACRPIKLWNGLRKL